MKFATHFFLFVALLAHIQSAQSQCTLTNGDFSTWEEVSELVKADLGVKADTTVFTPDDWVPFLRVFSVAFSDLFTSWLIGPDSTDLANNYTGLQRYVVDESSEDYAACMIPDKYADFADMITIFECTEEPSEIVLDLKFEGTRPDQFEIIYISGEIDPFQAYLDLTDLSQLQELGVRGFANGFLDQGPSEMTTFSLDVEYTKGVVNDPDVVDTAMIWLFAYGDSATIAEGEMGKYVIDNVSLTIPAASALSQNPDLFKIFPNPAHEFMEIQMEKDREAIYRISNSIGQQVLSGNLYGQTKLNLSSLVPGMYNILVDDGESINMKKFIKH